MRHLAYLFNLLEVLLWPLMGLILAIHGIRRRGPVRRDCLIAAGTLVLFGASDWFEAENGNEWWHPWWLLLWKAVCVVTLLAVVTIAWRRARMERGVVKGDKPLSNPSAGTDAPVPAE